MIRWVPASLAVAVLLLGGCAAGKPATDGDLKTPGTVAPTSPASPNLPSGDQAPAQKTSPSDPDDPAKSLDLQPKPRIIYSGVPCPTSDPGCDRQNYPGDGQFFTVTNYYVGITQGVVAGQAMAGWRVPEGQGFLMVGDRVYPLPRDKGTPTLEKVADGKASFITSTGDTGTVDLANGSIMYVK